MVKEIGGERSDSTIATKSAAVISRLVPERVLDEDFRIPIVLGKDTERIYKEPIIACF